MKFNKTVPTSRTLAEAGIQSISIELRAHGYPAHIRQAIVESLKMTQNHQNRHEQKLPITPQEKSVSNFGQDSWLEIPYSWRFY